jgi:tRNA pseudouridine55 synthase
MIALAGNCTRMAGFFTGLDKTYLAVMRFGEETDTLDPEGRVVAAGPVPGYPQIMEALPLFTGKISQVPPAYSAIHVNGRRAYRSALAGETPELKPREVEIAWIHPLSYEPPDFCFRVRCSKGTYIRSLARDLAAALGTRGRLESLCREAVGDFTLQEGVRPEAFHLGDLKTPEEVLPRIRGFSSAGVKPEAWTKIQSGRAFEEDFLEVPREMAPGNWLLLAAGRTIAVLEVGEGGRRYRLIRGVEA